MGYNVEDSPCLSQNETCTFSLVNGSFVTTIGIIGTVLNAFTIYCLVKHVQLPYRQNLFILSVAVSDLLTASLGLVRGLGIISPTFVGYNSQTQKQNWWCATYTFIGNTIWSSTMPVLVPLTLDRFIAVVFPLRYQTLMKTTNCRIFVGISWIVLIIILIHDVIILAEGAEMVYQVSYHRCVFDVSRSWKKNIYTLLPFIVIIIMYAVMLFFLKRSKIETKKMSITSILIITSGLITHLPDLLLIAFGVSMSYEVAQITTVTLWYTNSIWNPIIYFCTHKITKRELADTDIGRRISVAAGSLSDGSLVIARRLSSFGTAEDTGPKVMKSIDEIPE